jgi:hypothetical protein
MENQSLDQFFRKGMEGSESKPPTASWAQMEALLDAQNASPKTKKRPVIWYWAAAAILPFLFFFWWIFSLSETGKTELAGQKINQRVPEKMLRQNQEFEKVETQKPMIARGEPQKQFSISANEKIAKSDPVSSKKVKKAIDEKATEKPFEPVLNLAQNQNINQEESFPKTKIPVGIQAETKPAAEENQGYEIASIEIRKGQSKPEEKPEDLSVATIEWRKSKPEKLHWADRLANLKAGNIKNIPTMNEAKENIVAFLGFSK